MAIRSARVGAATLAGAILLGTFCFAGMAAAQQPASSVGYIRSVAGTRQTIDGWTGFSEDPEPRWVTRKKKIPWSRYGNHITNGLVFRYGTPPFSFEPTLLPLELRRVPPVVLVDSDRAVDVASAASADVSRYHEHVNNDKRDDYGEDGPWSSTLGYSSVIVDYDDRSLASASAMADVDSTIKTHSFQVAQRLLAGVTIDPIVKPSSFGAATSTAYASALYRINRPVSFALSGSFSGRFESAGLFTITDTASGAVLYQETLDGAADPGGHRFESTGRLSSGLFRVTLESLATESAAVDEQKRLSSAGEFDVDLELFEDGVGDFTGDRVVDGGDLALWASQFGRTQFGDLDHDGELTTGDFRLWETTASASDRNSDGAIDTRDFLGYVSGLYAGDANYDNQIDGGDFLAWQRAYKPEQALSAPTLAPLSSAAVAPVPEPATFSLLALAAALISQHRRRRAPLLAGPVG